MSAVADRRAKKDMGFRSIGAARFLASHRHLLWRVTRNELAATYAGSFLGLGWVVAGPLLVLVVYAVVYVEIFQIRVTNLTSREYVVYIFCGLVPYLMAAEALSTGVASVVTSKSVLSNTVFPIELAPVKAVLSSQAMMVVGMVVIIPAAVATGNVHPTLVLLPFFWALNVLWLLGANWVLALVNVVFRDLQSLLRAVLMVMLIASPIAYTPDMVQSHLKLLIALNPFAYFVVAYQQIIMLGIVPSIPHLAAMIVFSLGTFLGGSWFFSRAKRVILDYV